MKDRSEAPRPSRAAKRPLGTRDRVRRLGRRYSVFIWRHEPAWELGMALLAVVYVLTGLLGDAAGGAGPALDTVELVLTVVFVAEFASRFLAARRKLSFARRHWIDLIALIPVARGLRLARLIRVLRLGRSFVSLSRVAHDMERLAAHRGLTVLVLTWVAVMVMTSAAFWLVEQDENPALRDPLDALWWGVATLTGGDPGLTPRTPEGRIATGVLLVVGVALFTSITAVVTSFLLTRGQENRVDNAARASHVKYVEELRSAGILTDREADVAIARARRRSTSWQAAGVPDHVPRHARLPRRGVAGATDAIVRGPEAAEGSGQQRVEHGA